MAETAQSTNQNNQPVLSLFPTLEQISKNITQANHQLDHPQNSVEAIHQLRVLSLKARVYCQLVPIEKKLKGLKKTIKLLKKSRKRLSKARDLDIQISGMNQTLEQSKQAQKIAALLAKKRKKKIKKIHQSEIIFKATKQFSKLLEQSPQEVWHVSYQKLQKLILAEISLFSDIQEKIKNTADTVVLHNLRKQSKKLRHKVLLLKEMGESTYDDFLDSLKKMQDLLGTLHDHVLINDWLMDLHKSKKTIKHFKDELLKTIEHEKFIIGNLINEWKQMIPITLAQKSLLREVSAPKTKTSKQKQSKLKLLSENSEIKEAS